MHDQLFDGPISRVSQDRPRGTIPSMHEVTSIDEYRVRNKEVRAFELQGMDISEVGPFAGDPGRATPLKETVWAGDPERAVVCGDVRNWRGSGTDCKPVLPIEP